LREKEILKENKKNANSMHGEVTQEKDRGPVIPGKSLGGRKIQEGSKTQASLTPEEPGIGKREGGMD